MDRKKVAKNKNEIRICFSVSPELKHKLDENLQWGDTQRVYEALTIQLVELLGRFDSNIVKAGIISRKITLANLVDFEKGSDDAA